MQWHHETQYACAIKIIQALPANTNSDVIFVLGSAHSHRSIAEITAERFKACERPIVISGYSNESREIEKLIVSMGIPFSQIKCEHDASNTLENFLF